MSYNQYNTLVNNTRAIEIALAWQPGQQLSVADHAALQLYSGFGGIKAFLYPNAPKEEWISKGATTQDLRLYEPVIHLHKILQDHFSAPGAYQEVIDSLQASMLTAFYTPPEIPATIFKALREAGATPKRLYEPSAGAGTFIIEALHQLPTMEHFTAVEKDSLTGKVLQAINSTHPVPSMTHIMGLEETPTSDNGTYDLIASNIPFGNFRVFDPEYPDQARSGKIHNYFFAKGIDKIAEGGLLAFITTDGLLNSPGNQAIREYIFERTDFVSLTVMPDNLMKETGNTEAPSHLLIVQKNSAKRQLTRDEQQLVTAIEQENDLGKYYLNNYIQAHPDIILGDEIKAGKNQYGRATMEVWQKGPLREIADRLRIQLTADLHVRMNIAAFNNGLQPASPEPQQQAPLPSFTFLPVPAAPGAPSQAVKAQISLFDITPTETVNKALAYINSEDRKIVFSDSARIISAIRTKEKPDHESFALVTAKDKKTRRFKYKLVSNVMEIRFPVTWIDNTALAKELDKLSERLAGFAHSYSYTGDLSFKVAVQPVSEASKLFASLKPFYSKGTLIIHQGAVGTLAELDQREKTAGFRPFTSPVKDLPFYQSYITVRDAYSELFEKEATGIEQPALRTSLNEAYDAFRASYGSMNETKNRKLILEDAPFGLKIMSSVERGMHDSFEKADILLHSLIRQDEERIAPSTPMEALAISLNEKGRLDLPFMSDLCRSNTQDVQEALKGHIYLNPTTDRWETADEYLSGNVVDKLADAARLAAEEPANLHYRESLEALNNIQPERVPFELVGFNYGERWIPTEYYSRYASELFEVTTRVDHFASVDKFTVTPDRDNPKITQEHAVSPRSGRVMGGDTLMEHALENTAPFFTYTIMVGKEEIRVPDNDAIQLAHEKIEKVRSGFTTWLSDLPQHDKDRIEQLYNDKFNCFVLRNYSGDHLTFPGLDVEALKALGVAEIYKTQKDSAWRIIVSRGALIDHEVGLGKTLTAILANQEMKRLGIVKKPLLLALKANVSQIAETYRVAYPHARVLSPGPEDFTPSQRRKIYNQILNNDWDCIILTHDQFKKIPQSPRVQREIILEEISMISKDLDTLQKLGGQVSKRMLRGLQTRRENLRTRLKKVTENISIKADIGIDFEILGFDFMQVDESHSFKNLEFTTRHDRVAGLGNQRGAEKCLNMLFAIRTLQQRFKQDLCVTFLSGTPITNSLTEMYLLFKYLCPGELERQEIRNFDAWAAAFARKTTEFEFSITNEIIAKERFRHFVKIPELAMLYNMIADYKTSEHIHIDKPSLDEALVHTPPTPEQQEFLKKLVHFARTGDATVLGRKALTPEEDQSRMLLATNYAKKMTADMRLISPHYSDHPDNKINKCARLVADWYHASHEHKGTQLVFCDLGTPKKGVFNMYDALKDTLHQNHGIPHGEITFIHDWPPDRKKELFALVNGGKIRVLIGSTEKAGVGNNFQERVVAMHQLDIPWRPSDFDQRNGRGARKGNWVAKLHFDNRVKNYIYAVEQTLDSYKFNLLKNKQTFITQYKTSKINVRTLDEGAYDEKTGMSFGEYIAILTGDTSLLELEKVKKKIMSLENLKGAFLQDGGRAKTRLHQLLYSKTSSEEKIRKYEKDRHSYNSQLQHDKDGIKLNPLQLRNEPSQDPEVTGAYLIKLNSTFARNAAHGDQEVIGRLYGFDCYTRIESVHSHKLNAYVFHRSFFVKSPETGVEYYSSAGNLNIDNPKTAARYFLNAIHTVNILFDKETEALRQTLQDIPQMEKIVARTFDRETELQSLKAEFASLDRKVSISIKAAKENSANDTFQETASANENQETDSREQTPIKKLASTRYLPDLEEATSQQKRII